MSKKLVAKRGTAALIEQDYETIQQHIIDPENSPLPEKLKEQFNRVLQCARLLDDYPNDSHIINIMQFKYKVSITQIRKDIALARELYKTNHTFDWDFWFSWQLQDQLALIRECKLKGDLKNWNAAKKELRELIGAKPEAVDDPRRMEKNQFIIRVQQSDGSVLNIDFDKLRGLNQQTRRDIIDTLYTPIDDEQTMEIMNS